MCDCRRRGVCGVSHGCRAEQKKGIASCELSLLHFAIWSAVRMPVVVRQSNYCSKIDGNCVSYPSHRWILTYRRIYHHSRELFGEEVPTSSQIPIVLLYGPPGSGKSFAMRMLAAQSGLQPWELKATALQERTREPVAVFQTILERMGRMEISAELKYATIDWQCWVRYGSWSQCPHCGSLMYNDQYFQDYIYQTRATTGKPHAKVRLRYLAECLCIVGPVAHYGRALSWITNSLCICGQADGPVSKGFTTNESQEVRSRRVARGSA